MSASHLRFLGFTVVGAVVLAGVGGIDETPLGTRIVVAALFLAVAVVSLLRP